MSAPAHRFPFCAEGERSRYGFAWVTGFFLITLVGRRLFGRFAYASEQQQPHPEPIELTGYVIQMMRDTLENWQSKFLQLV